MNKKTYCHNRIFQLALSTDMLDCIMNLMKYFWTHKDNIPEGMGYGQFTKQHCFWLVLTALFTLAYVLGYGHADPAGKSFLLKAAGIVLILIDAVKMVLIGCSDVKLSEYLPLEICSFAAYFIVADAFFPGHAMIGDMLVTLFLPGALMAVFFPTTSTLPSFNFYTIHQFLYHGLLIAYITARFVCGEIPLTYPHVWTSIFNIILIAAAVYVIDTAFDKNFMFLKGTYGNPMLEAIRRISGDGIAYTGGLVCFCIIMIHVFFVIFKCIEILFIH